MTTTEDRSPPGFVPAAAATTGTVSGATEDCHADSSGAGRTTVGSAEATVQVIWGSATDRGRVRRVNEDAMLAAPPVFVVSDGMGGHAAGDVAATIVIEEFGAAIDSDVDATIGSDWIRDCIRRAGRRIRDGAGGGATVVGAAVTEHDGASYWLAFNIGDSRAYRCREGELTQISVDHSYVQELVEAGELQREEMRRHPQRNVITRAVGLIGDTDLDCWLIPAHQGERLLLCTDGITGELGDAELAGVLTGNVDPQDAADALVAAALAAGGRDNATAVVVDVLTVTTAGPDSPTRRYTAEADGDPESDLERTLPRTARGPDTA